MFERVLIANRGEIAVRIARTLRRLGVASVAVHSDGDDDSPHVRAADSAVRLGPAPARESYLSIERLVDAAVRSGAQAVHPGYGFLSENAAFARAVEEAGLVFVGPTPDAIAVMGDKILAKRAVSAAGVPVLGGRTDPGLTDADLIAAAADVGYPVLVKPSAGGGGKGMHVAASEAELAAVLPTARREASASFGDDTLFVERFLARPRHIEVQVLADAHGTTVHLGERECSLQRRHQKVVEEAPSTVLDAGLRATMGAAAVEVAAAVGYRGAGTVEFLLADGAFFFLEMNTRLQVEHPVTELVTGLDLVEQQLRVAAGEPLGLGQGDVRLSGHAVEVRVYAEDPSRGFLPATGPVLALREPDPASHPGVRVDSGIAAGVEVGPHYDPMLSKIIAFGPDRATALARLEHALAGTTVLGVRTNLDFLRTLLADPDVRAGRIDTAFLDRRLTDPGGPPAVPTAAHAAYGLLQRHLRAPAGPLVDPWDVPSGWRVGGPRPLTLRVEPGVEIRVSAARVEVGEEACSASSRLVDGSELVTTLDGVSTRWLWALEDGTPDGPVWLGGPEGTYRLAPAARVARARESDGSGDELRSPMPGVVLAVNAAKGDVVAAGRPLVVIEAMKMEHTVAAPRDGRVTDVLVKVGDQVRIDQPLVVTGT